MKIMYYSVIETATDLVVVTESPLSTIPLNAIGLTTPIWEGSKTDAEDMAGRLGSAFGVIISPKPH